MLNSTSRQQPPLSPDMKLTIIWGWERKIEGPLGVRKAHIEISQNRGLFCKHGIICPKSLTPHSAVDSTVYVGFCPTGESTAFFIPQIIPKSLLQAAGFIVCFNLEGQTQEPIIILCHMSTKNILIPP